MSEEKDTSSAPQFGSFWKCLSCADSPDFKHDAMMEHLRKDHAIDIKSVKGKRTMKVHMDGDTWFSSSYEWKIADVLAIQNIRTKRAFSAMWS